MVETPGTTARRECWLIVCQSARCCDYVSNRPFDEGDSCGSDDSLLLIRHSVLLLLLCRRSGETVVGVSLDQIC